MSDWEKSLGSFLRLLDANRISYRLDRVRDAVMVVVAVPGQRWEVEFFEDGQVEAECYTSDGKMHGAEILEEIVVRGR